MSRPCDHWFKLLHERTRSGLERILCLRCGETGVAREPLPRNLLESKPEASR